MTTWTFTVPIQAMGAVRMNRSDAWKKRPRVLRYRAYRDVIRKHAPADLTKEPLSLEIVCRIPTPESWSAKKKIEHAGAPHRQKPDADNIAKGVMDALWDQDQVVAELYVRKSWITGLKAEIYITVKDNK